MGLVSLPQIQALGQPPDCLSTDLVSILTAHSTVVSVPYQYLVPIFYVYVTCMIYMTYFICIFVLAMMFAFVVVVVELPQAPEDDPQKR